MITIRGKKYLLISAATLFIIVLLFSACAEDVLFSVRNEGRIISHTDNRFIVEAPEAGTFTFKVSDSYHVYRVITQEVDAGTNSFIWDGCSYNLERINPGKYTVDCSLSAVSGKEYGYDFRIQLVTNAQYLQFALPSGDTVYLDDDQEWFLEAKTILDGKIRIDLFENEKKTPVCSVWMTSHKGRVEHYTFRKIIGKNVLNPGQYHVNVYEESIPESVISFLLQVKEGACPVEPVVLTGNIMPDSDASVDELWSEMMKPGVVLDIDYLERQQVYEDADSSSRVLGTVHGQTQCLSVLQIAGEWAKIGAWNHEDASYIEGWVPYSLLKNVAPSGEYGLLVSKKDQTLTVYHHGKPIETLLISTGRMEKDKLFRETSAGCFLTGLHRVDFSTLGSRYDFVIQYDGGNLLHQIPYYSGGQKDFTLGKANLGSKASHACVRIQDEPGKNTGMNAYWIWTHIPYHTKLIILDDREEREKEKAMLSGEVPFYTDSATIHTENRMGLVADDNSIILTFCGEITPGDREEYQYRKGSFRDTIEENGISYPLSNMKALFESDDLTCIGMGCALKENGKGTDRTVRNPVRGLPEYAGMFADSSVELVSLSGCHILDYQEEGFQSTVRALEGKAGWISAQNTTVLTIRGVRFGFATCTEEEYLADPHMIEKDIASLKEEGCTYIISLCHWGEENSSRHNTLQEALARTCARAGADLVIGYHPGKVQGIDYVQGVPVVYSMGRLINGGAVNVHSSDALTIQAVFTKNRKNVPDLWLVPVVSCPGNGRNNYQPVLADGEDALRVLNAVQEDSPYLIPQP